MSTSYDFRIYKTGDDERIVDLLKLSFPDWARREHPIDYWKWKYMQGPCESIIRVVEKDGEIVGVGHGKLLKIKIGSSTIQSHYSDDVAVHPDHRGAGIYSKMQIMSEKLRAEKGVKFNYSISNNPIIIKHTQKTNRFEFPYKISHMSRIKDISKHTKIKSIKNREIMIIGYTLSKNYNIIKTSLSQNIRNKNDCVLKEVDNFNIDVDLFYDKIKENYDFIVERNSNYLNWRYQDRRGGNYKSIEALEDNEIVGYAVIGTRNDENYPQGYIVDLLAIPGRNDVAYSLIENACKFFDSVNMNSVNYQAANGSQYGHLASSLGFIDTSRFSRTYVTSEYSDKLPEFEVFKTSTPTRIHFNIGEYF